ncbi:MAG: pyruvate, phosphate dikinase [Bacillota bacterium]
MFDEGNASMRALLGGKGANLAEMTRLGLPVPPGFTISTAACIEYYQAGQVLGEGLREEIFRTLCRLEATIGRTFGDPGHPLLVSVRSGAAVSMPGMMDTILNLGLNNLTVQGLAESTGDPRFAYDCYRRFIQMFSDVVLGLPLARFEDVLERHKEATGVLHDGEIPAEVLQAITVEYLQLVKSLSGRVFPQDPKEQLIMAVEAVFRSWHNDRAVVYRRVHRINDDMGTAVNVQAMVFGNMGPTSATGVLFTRNPSTGAREMLGEYLINAQGEDVVAGIRTPLPIQQLAGELPQAYVQLMESARRLESHYRDMQDIEFTIEKGRLFLLQTRACKRTAAAAVKIASDLVHEDIISRAEAILRIDPEQVEKLLHRTIDPGAHAQVIARGLPASPGAATGVVVFHADDAERRGEAGDRVILVRPETAPDDMHGIVQAQGILTSRGGMTCHAAIVARGMGKPAVVGCEALGIDLSARKAWAGTVELSEGDLITIDGATGQVMLGEVAMVEPQLGREFQELLDWCDRARRLGVRANADTPQDAVRAREFGAEGIGLCRTEHMFMAADRLPAMQAMILADGEEQRRAALDRLLPMQKEDFKQILRVMEGFPVTIRLLDPPLHEFLPDIEELVIALGRARAEGESEAVVARQQELVRKARALSEVNPMLGFRGCRLGVVYPEIYAMQAQAIFEATVELMAEGCRDIRPEVMIPLVGHARELAVLEELVRQVAAQVKEASGMEFPVVVGTMIEVPRGALTADEVARHAEFFSFGTNDLTQMTYGFSRDDAEAKFLHHYLRHKILDDNPFAVLDEAGVGKLVTIAVELGRKTRPDLKIGICGEHGGDPRSIGFCHQAGLDYISCSPYRVPVARLAAAQAALGK